MLTLSLLNPLKEDYHVMNHHIKERNITEYMRIYIEENRIERSIRTYLQKIMKKCRHTPTDRQVPLSERRENGTTARSKKIKLDNA